jgi:hypothetical protein
MPQGSQRFHPPPPWHPKHPTRVLGSPLHCLPPEAAFFLRCFPAVARYAHRLPVRLIPEQRPIALVRLDVISCLCRDQPFAVHHAGIPHTERIPRLAQPRPHPPTPRRPIQSLRRAWPVVFALVASTARRAVSTHHQPSAAPAWNLRSERHQRFGNLVMGGLEGLGRLYGKDHSRDIARTRLEAVPSRARHHVRHVVAV